jgi:hypothetical protein
VEISLTIRNGVTDTAHQRQACSSPRHNGSLCNIHTDAAGCALGDTNYCNLLCIAVRCDRVSCISFELLTDWTMKIAVLRDMTPRSIEDNVPNLA